MATGDIIWKTTGGRVQQDAYAETSDKWHATQTTQLGPLTVAVPVGDSGHSYSADAVTLTTSLAQPFNTQPSVVRQVAFDPNKTYTITVTEE